MKANTRFNRSTFYCSECCHLILENLLIAQFARIAGTETVLTEKITWLLDQYQ